MIYLLESSVVVKGSKMKDLQVSKFFLLMVLSMWFLVLLLLLFFLFCFEMQLIGLISAQTNPTFVLIILCGVVVRALGFRSEGWESWPSHRLDKKFIPRCLFRDIFGDTLVTLAL